MASCQFAAALDGGHCGRTVVNPAKLQRNVGINSSIPALQVAKERDAAGKALQTIISDDKGGLCKTWTKSGVVRVLYMYFLR